MSSHLAAKFEATGSQCKQGGTKMIRETREEENIQQIDILFALMFPTPPKAQHFELETDSRYSSD